jgi:polyhydroxyalkanoate synthesis regulator phasin
MPQPKKSTASRKSSSSTRSRARAAAEDSSSSLREQLTRLLNPVDAVLVTRERLQEVLDDAVERGRMTRTDAADLMSEILQRGRRTTEDLLADVDTRLGGPADRVRREVDRARRAAGLGPAFPISGYEGLTAAQVQARLEDLTPAQLRKVRDYERRNANRKTVLAAIESRLGA